MEYIVIIISLIVILLGIAGSLLPGLPGSPLFIIGLLCSWYFAGADISVTELIIVGVLVVGTFLTDIFIPASATKKFGGTKGGVWGSTIGLIVGLFIPLPFGLNIILFPFLGAVTGEYLAGGRGWAPWKAGLGNLVGFLVTVGIKFFLGIYCFVRLLYVLLDKSDFLSMIGF